MGGYIANFTVYTMAMIGLICFAVFVYKKFTDGSMRTGNTKFLSVEESMSLTPRKTLHIVRAGNEKFLIASDVDRTTLISKLDESHKTIQQQGFERFMNIEPEPKKFQQTAPVQAETVQEVKKVHLEPVKVKISNNNIRRGLDKRAGNAGFIPQEAQKTVTLDFETPKDHGFSTMKEMAMKINEL